MTGHSDHDHVPGSAATKDRWPLGSVAMFAEDFLRYTDATLIEKREGEFNFAGATWQMRDRITDGMSPVLYRCERVR